MLDIYLSYKFCILLYVIFPETFDLSLQQTSINGIISIHSEVLENISNRDFIESHFHLLDEICLEIGLIMDITIK